MNCIFKSLIFIILVTPFISLGQPKLQFKIISSNHTLNKKIQSQLNIFKNKSWSDNLQIEIKNTIEDFLKKNKYTYSQVSPIRFIKKSSSSTQLQYTIVHPYQYKIILKGNTISDRILKKFLNPNLLASSPTIEDSMIDSLKKYYLSLAYNKVKIQKQVNIDKNLFKKKITIRIKEGPRFIIQKISIRGSLYKNKRRYNRLFMSLASSAVARGWFVEKDVDVALQKLITSFRKKGYYQARIYEKKITILDSNVLIDITLSEGRPITVGNVIIQGYKALPISQIQEFVSFKKGDLLDIDMLQLNLEQLIKRYHSLGYLEARIKNINNVIRIQSSLKPIDIFIDIEEGKAAILSNLKVRGNKEISSEYIIRSSLLKNGDILNLEKRNQAYDALDRLALFSSIQIHSDSIIEVKERNFRFLRFTAGVRTEDTFTLKSTLEFEDKNFLNIDGSHLFMNVDLKSNYILLNFLNHSKLFLPQYFIENDFSTSYLKHNSFGSYFDIQMTYSLSRNIFSFSRDQLLLVKNIEWIQSNKFTISMQRQFDLNTMLRMNLLDFELRQPSVIGKKDLEYKRNQNLTIANVGLFFTKDKRDNIFIPKSGYKTSITLEYAPPQKAQLKDFINSHSSQLHFIKTQWEQNFYWPFFNKKITYALALGGGFAYRFPNTVIPISRLFILGGIYSIRGYDGHIEGRRIPSKKDFPIDNSNSLIKSSSYYFSNKHEIRFPLFSQLSGAVFYDGGFVALPELNIKYSKSYRHSTGVSVYIQLNLISLVFDIAYRLNKEPDDDSRFDINLSLGAF